MENNINEQIDNSFEQIKAEVTQQVMSELAANNDLAAMVSTMKDYISTGADGLSYFAYMARYQ